MYSSLFLMLMFSSIVSPQSFAKAKTSRPDRQMIITMAAAPWCPYNCEPDSEKPGYMVEIAIAIANDNGYQLRYVTMPWSRALKEARKGRVDGVFGATKQNGKGLRFGDLPMGNDSSAMVTRQSFPRSLDGPKGLEGLTIGIIQDYSYDDGGPVDQMIADRTKRSPHTIVVHQRLNSLTSLVQMLLIGRIDVLFENQLVINHTAQKMGVRDRLSISEPFFTDKVWFAFKPGREGEKFAEMMDRGVKKMQQNGEFRNILDRYFVAPWYE